MTTIYVNKPTARVVLPPGVYNNLQDGQPLHINQAVGYLEVKGVSGDGNYRLINAIHPVASALIQDVHLTGIKRQAARFGSSSKDWTIKDCTFKAAPGVCTEIPAGIMSDGTASGLRVSNVEVCGFVLKLTKPGQYVNGDGVSDEWDNADMVYDRLNAHDNGNGGADLKSNGAIVTNSRLGPDNAFGHRCWAQGQAQQISDTDLSGNHKAAINACGPCKAVYTRCVLGDGLHVQIDGETMPADLTFIDCPGITKPEDVRWKRASGKPPIIHVVVTPAPVLAPPAAPAPVYDYTSQAGLPDGNHDGLVIVATDPTLLKLFPKGTVLKLVASDASGFHYKRQPAT